MESRRESRRESHNSPLTYKERTLINMTSGRRQRTCMAHRPTIKVLAKAEKTEKTRRARFEIEESCIYGSVLFFFFFFLSVFFPGLI